MNVVTISSKNQISLPVALLRDMGFGSGSKLVVERSNDKISLKPINKSVVESLAGSLRRYIPMNKLHVPWEEAVVMARKARVKLYAKANS